MISFEQATNILHHFAIIKDIYKKYFFLLRVANIPGLRRLTLTQPMGSVQVGYLTTIAQMYRLLKSIKLDSPTGSIQVGNLSTNA